MTAAEQAEKRRRKALLKTIFINGRQKRVLRVTAEMRRIEMEAFAIANGKKIDLLQLGLYEHLHALALNRDGSEQTPEMSESEPASMPF
ncbi:MAG: hypothetical protein IPK97_01520 [Ahniella sp.]|nr:hypothetical protein [Ahniella sp.]